MPSPPYSAASLVPMLALVGPLVSMVRAQDPALADLGDRIIASVAAMYPDSTFDTEASRLRGSPLSTAEPTPDRTVSWFRPLVWDLLTGRAFVECTVYPSLREAEIAVSRMREYITIATSPLPGVQYDATSTSNGTMQVRRGRVVARLSSRRSALPGPPPYVTAPDAFESRQLADLIVREIERDPELLRDSLTAGFRQSC